MSEISMGEQQRQLGYQTPAAVGWTGGQRGMAEVGRVTPPNLLRRSRQRIGCSSDFILLSNVKPSVLISFMIVIINRVKRRAVTAYGGGGGAGGGRERITPSILRIAGVPKI